MEDYLSINKQAWNKRTALHLEGDFYKHEEFLKGKSSLNDIELKLLGDVKDKEILHLQCHFGQDTLSLARMGAKAMGLDLSDKAIEVAKDTNRKLDLDASFICSDVYTATDKIDKQFDIIFTSYGVLGWLPDLKRWAEVVASLCKPNGYIVLAEFHPVIWMFDDAVEKIAYPYTNSGAMKEELEGTYGNHVNKEKIETVYWNHGLEESMQNLIEAGFLIEDFREYDYSPYNCFENTVEIAEGKFQIKGKEGMLPLVFSIKAKKI